MTHRKNIHYAIYILTVIGAVAVVTVLLLLRFGHKEYNQILTAGSLPIPVSIASTPAQQQQGLSGTASLPANAGKLFVFSQPGNYGFWMKDMNYSLDFVWMDSTMKILGITANVAPNTYPQVFYCDQPACPNGQAGRVEYVLEVNANFAAKNNLTVGEQLSL